jgi:hypothetical protein
VNDREVVREVLDLAGDVAPLPPWVPRWAVKVLAALVVAAIVVLVRELDVGELLKAWARSATPAPPNEAPVMPMPREGMPVPGPGPGIAGEGG